MWYIKANKEIRSVMTMETLASFHVLVLTFTYLITVM